MTKARPLVLLASCALVAACATQRASLPKAVPAPSSPFVGLTQGMQVVMGTRLFIALEPPTGQRGAKILAEAFAIARAHDALLSNYRPESPLSLLNAGTLPAPTPGALLRFLRLGQRYCQQSAGAFDLTIGELLATLRTPTKDAARLAAALETVGCDKLRIDNDRALLGAGTRLDPGALGKGYAVDAMVELLRARHVRRAFIDFGGSSFYGLGAPRGRRGWPILVDRDAVRRNDLPRGRATLQDAGLSCSATLAGGKLHIVDPRSGQLVTARRLAVVVSPSASEAEALSTALIVDPTLQRRLASAFPRARLRIFTPEKTRAR